MKFFFPFDFELFSKTYLLNLFVLHKECFTITMTIMKTGQILKLKSSWLIYSVERRRKKITCNFGRVSQKTTSNAEDHYNHRHLKTFCLFCWYVFVHDQNSRWDKMINDLEMMLSCVVCKLQAGECESRSNDAVMTRKQLQQPYSITNEFAAIEIWFWNVPVTVNHTNIQQQTHSACMYVYCVPNHI